MRPFFFRIAAAPALLAAVTAQADGDPAKGASLFRQCAACHSTRSGEHLTGPSLAAIWKRKAGTVDGFARYSDALKAAKVIWDADSLDRWLASPAHFIPGTTMSFPGMREAASRGHVIAYLRAVAEGEAPRAATAGGMMGGMMGGGRKADLRQAPPEGQVRSIRHCGDTYTVETADGKREKVWEFNLRFKTDSSELGPRPGRPAVIGAGMRGDRASVVFASPAEMSAFIESSCD